ncbi:RagB/SusD family nutrient uptake outer membrane protein [Echinicola soli]|uniref:RagB/SusD family nutrient uptake outer membrane protein n=1 Tax=Echinicola soli TaxID=2591634 RepID=A0A514CJ25_9BACT|nr:RagB/SusD family nutrient uptake outer membrane protein [Echinicola soli]QDH79825.1 RagB/SusD family nutrient uptake outer membrane protein [Echinicola soli]
MKNIIYIVLASAVMWGCGESFLELAPESNANANNFYQTQEDFDIAVNAAYATLYTFYAPDGPVSYCAEQMSDNATMYNVPGIQADRWAFKDYTLVPSNTEVYRLWKESYNLIFNLNIVLANIETADVPADYKAQVNGEMKFLRALYYFYMVQMWGDLPLVTTPVGADEAYDILRSPEEEVYGQVVADLNEAVANLPSHTSVSVPGKASKEAAQVLLGKVYLTLGDNGAAESILMEVYNKEFSLLNNYADLWQVENKNTVESIFEVQYLGGSPNYPYSPYWSAFTPTENFSITAYGGGMNMVTDDLYEEYEEGDPRRDASIYTGYTNETGDFIAIKFPKKWSDPDAAVVNGNELASNNFIVLRYADVLLMLSEASGDPKYLNEVRQRAGVPLYGTSGYPSDLYPTLDLAIEHERRSELALEFHRWFDLKRTDRAVPVLQSKGIPVTESTLLLPIPEVVIQQNPEISQNDY